MKSNRGFTLIELLVVIAIIGILSSVVLASLNSARQKSRDARRVADIKQIQLALELYADGTAGEYPDALFSLASTYIASEPKDPSTAASYAYDNLASGGAACMVATGDCMSYHLGANLEQSNHTALAGDADVCAATGAGCTRALAGTTLSGIDATNDCIGTGTAVHCYDVTP